MIITGTGKNFLVSYYQIELYKETPVTQTNKTRIIRSYRGLRYEGSDNSMQTDGEGREDESLAIRIMIPHVHKLEKLRNDLELILLGHYPKVVVKKYSKTKVVKKHMLSEICN